jgi:tRNA modification GTPase
MNALSGQSRSIVAHEPGTTRDTVELAVDWGGLPVVLIDTAGLGTATGSAEEQGQRRTLEEIRASDLCLVVLDGSAALDPDDSSVLRAVGERELILLRNKCDLPVVWGESQLPQPQLELMTVSCLSGKGVRELKNRATEVLRDVMGNGDCPLVVSARHRRALEEASECLSRARRQASRGCWLEEVAEELREARSALRRITGDDAGEELLDRIFSRFCVGK